MNKYQKKIVREFIDLHNRFTDEWLREIGLLNPNGTFPSNKDHLKSLEDWFFDSLRSYRLAAFGDEIEVCYEIRGYESHNGIPIIFEFDASLWEHFLEEATCVTTALNQPCIPLEDTIIDCNICEDGRGETWETLFVDGNYGAFEDIEGFKAVKDIIDAQLDGIQRMTFESPNGLSTGLERKRIWEKSVAVTRHFLKFNSERKRLGQAKP